MVNCGPFESPSTACFATSSGSDRLNVVAFRDSWSGRNRLCVMKNTALPKIDLNTSRSIGLLCVTTNAISEELPVGDSVSSNAFCVEKGE